MANTSHSRGELKLSHSEPYWLGIGSVKCNSQGLPICSIGKIPACITAKIVIASAERLIATRHCCRKSSSIAEMNVPACPMPIHHTKLVISHAQPTVLLSPHTPIPSLTVSHIHQKPQRAATEARAKASHHCPLARPSIGRATSLLIV